MITNTTAKSVYTIASGVTTYAIGFAYQYNPDNTPQINVYIKPHPETPLIYGTDYTISADGLSVELISGYEVGDKLVILRAIPMVQLSDYVIGRIDPEQIEHDFDEAVMRDQQLKAEIDLLEALPIDHELRIQAIEEVIPEEATSTNQLADKQHVQDGLDTKVDVNAAITGATHTKITYDSKGLVTGGTDITLSDVTDITATATEVNVLDGITASTAELNIMDGVTATTAEINHLSGVTSAVQTQLDGKVDENAAITGATKCKITYDSKGLVTGGADIDTSDLTDIAISSVQDGEFLRYDGVAGKWKNAASTASVGFDGITGDPYDNTNLSTALNAKAPATAIDTLLAALYPVGSIYIGTQNYCPVEALMPGTTWQLVSSNRALWTGNGTNGNTTIAAGLPNITGDTGKFNYAGLGDSGAADSALYTTGSAGTYNYSIATNSPTLHFNAARVNSIYGNSSTVQPPAYVVNVWRRTA